MSHQLKDVSWVLIGKSSQQLFICLFSNKAHSKRHAVQRLFEARLRTNTYLGFGTGWVYDVFPDGQRFLIDQVTDEQAAPSPITVITNWTSMLH